VVSGQQQPLQFLGNRADHGAGCSRAPALHQLTSTTSVLLSREQCACPSVRAQEASVPQDAPRTTASSPITDWPSSGTTGPLSGSPTAQFPRQQPQSMVTHFPPLHCEEATISISLGWGRHKEQLSLRGLS
jgi:hypothetical protein